MGVLIGVVLALLRDLIHRVSDSSGDHRRESVLTTAARPLSGKEDSPASTHTVCETRAGCLEQVLLVGASTGHRAIEHIRSLAASRLPIVLAVEIATRRTAAATQETTNADPHHVGRESELGRRADCR